MTFATPAAIVLAGLLSTTAAFAQNALVEIDDAVMLPSMNVSVDALDDMDVYDTAGKKIGEIEEVVGTNAETPTAVSVEFENDLVTGDDDRLVPLESLSMDGKRVVLALDTAAINQLPAYDD
ncbi:hypothetical protein Sa4125_26220 [Aureimonas sp. SA4125]|uniref:PRC-barrel domain-containing protein n=1 Tax=Aureimonas sp. SA4125 TaxID=2826993 RepID=UPI001CC3547E|nr:PRC-barrel domain-containing protein [Aureimonas sp. SA4125]BDA85080.1 hypothetical protein Sa4125_26220 [Aureimonas sp. SA4125]